MKIVVTDDEIAALETFLPVVLDTELECKMFKDDPLAALDYVRKERVDAAVLDCRMPEIDGVMLAEKMIAADPSIRIIMISAYKQNTEDIKNRLGNNFVGFLYKPYDRAKLIGLLASITPRARIFIRTFNAFDLFVGGMAVRFPSSKAKELLAVLTDANGSYVGMETVIDRLWPDKDAEHGKRLYRDAVARLRLILRQNGIERLARFERARAVIDTEFAECDMWDLVRNGGVFCEGYMPQYEWAMETEAFLQNKFRG